MIGFLLFLLVSFFLTQLLPMPTYTRRYRNGLINAAMLQGTHLRYSISDLNKYVLDNRVTYSVRNWIVVFT